jgi:hypothetical protein
MEQPKTAAVKTAAVKDLVDSRPTAPHLKVTSGMQLSVAYLDPVIYTDGNGGGPNEYAAGPNPSTANIYEINAISSGQILAAFWEPYDNIPDLATFSFIDVSPLSSQDIQLAVAGLVGAFSRLRLKITVLYFV